jgi:hypothetical protein
MPTRADSDDIRIDAIQLERADPRRLSARECEALAADEIWGRDAREPIPYWPTTTRTPKGTTNAQ